MSTKKQNAVLIGGGAAACAACCAGPIVGFLAAIGLGTIAGVALFGTAALAVGVLATAIVLRRRKRQATACIPADGRVDVAVPTRRAKLGA